MIVDSLLYDLDKPRYGVKTPPY